MSTNGQHHDLLALPHGYLLNHLVIKSVIGRGGFGITYLAEDVHTRELVAVKEMIPPSVGVRSADYSISPVSESDRKEHQWATRSFLKEAETILKLKHPNFVRMYEFFEQNGTAYLVMPYIAGDHLKQLIEKNGPRPEHEVKSLLFPLIDAVKDMHHLGILHRDIKPNNIVINQNDRQPVLLDFGAARNYTADEHSGVTSLVSVGYTPIEQYSTNPEFQGPWSDIYSLAAVAYFMFTGKSPPDAAKRSQQLLRGETDPLIPLHRIPGVQISPSLSDALTHALQVNERERPQSIHEWMLILQPQPAPSPAARPPRLPYQPVAPQRPAQPRRAKKRSSNRPVIILLTVAIFLTISLGGIAIYLGQSQGTPSSSDSGLPSAIRTTPSSGGQPSSPSAPSRATTIKEFLQSFYRAEQSGDQLRYYADEVHYFGKTRDKSYIQNATQTYWKLWPNRKVEALNFDEVQTHKRQNITHVTAPYRAEVDNGVMTRIINRT
ncbi:MAG: serine/threonine protein kinase, partial [Akkermansiaceae bacterium]